MGYSLANVPATICKAMNLPLMEGAEIQPISEVIELLNGETAEKCLFFSPDAVGAWIFDKYPQYTNKLVGTYALKQPLSSVMPSVTPVCYATMMSGVMPEVHGIKKYEKFPITVETVFHALKAAGKKSCIIAKLDSSCEIIFRNAPCDVIVTEGDKDAHQKAIEIIEKDEYDFILVYECEYDDNMHATQLETEYSLSALKYNAESALELIEYAKKKWAGKKALITFSPDHGIHTDPVTKLGTHGTSLDEDMKIYHLFGVI